MEFMFVAAWLIPSFLFVILTPLLLLAAKVCFGKSITDPSYPPVKGSMFNLIFYLNKLYDHQTEVARTCHTYRLLGTNESYIFTTDVRNIEHIVKTRFENYTKGEYNLELLNDMLGKGILLADGEKWRHQRKLASYEFSTRVLRDFSCSVFRKCAAKVVRIVSNDAISSNPFDLQELLMRCALDSIFKVGFGVELNCLEGSNKEGTVFGAAFDELNELVYRRYYDPIWKLKKFLNIGTEALIKADIRIVNDFVYKLIRTKRRNLASNKELVVKEDIMSRFLAESDKDPEGMSDEYLKDIILNFLIAGKDTSAATLAWFIYLLCKNPLVQEKLFKEINSFIDNEEINEEEIDSFVEKIDESMLQKLQYLHAALSETLRLYPALPTDGRCAGKEDTLPDGYKVKKGDGVYYLAYAMGRMHYIWGDDAEEFKPERWIENGVFKAQSPFKFIAFHGGPRTCLGKEFAYRQMKIVSIALVRFFKFKLADESKTVRYRTMFTLHVDEGLQVLAAPRSLLQKTVK